MERPDPLCPPVTALAALARIDQEPYEQRDPFFDEQDIAGRNLYIGCGYERSDVGEHDVVLEDHLHMRLRTKIHENVRSTGFSGIYDYVLPIESSNLSEWADATYFHSRQRVWREECESATPCPEGEKPTLRNHALHTVFEGRVGNLEFEGRISYIAEQIPEDAVTSALAVFREYVLAMVDQLELVS